ncbi:MAG TPA: hypothetical protein HPP97_13435 [Desulfuromonadales bacterium]|nr:hypothetical protein [Desulfuromonadales bacterium]
MHIVAKSAEKKTISTLLPGHSCFQESLDHFGADCDCCFDYSGGRIHDGHDDDWEWY